MHKPEPTLIIMKRRIAGPEIIDPGMGFAAARKAMIHADGLDAGAPCPGSAGPEPTGPTGPTGAYEPKLEELRRRAGQLTEAVDDLAHTGPDQAEDAEAGEEGAEEASEEETHGEERELS